MGNEKSPSLAKSQSLAVHLLDDSETVAFAARELRAYISRISPFKASVASAKEFDPAAGGIWLGIASQFGSHLSRTEIPHPMDDAFWIRSVDGALILSGVNPRSILFAVYAFLEELGCRFVRMGADGEILPRLREIPISGHDRYEAASSRYRGVCIEGSLSAEHAAALVDYLAKKRFNTYFIQFQTAYIFWSRWYDRDNVDPKLPVSKAVELTASLAASVKKRGLALQMVGHGWTNESLGVQGLGWYKTNDLLPPEKKSLLAEVDGVRDWWGGIPINTELCLSNRRAFEGLVEYIAGYAKKHPEVDQLHLWMSDGKNNRCSCDNCRKRLPSEWYVDLLNAVDERLEEERLPTKIVFLLYYDLLWEPKDVAIRNPDRFVLMFAPISRYYNCAFTEQPKVAEEPRPFRLNANVFPRSTAVLLQYLENWKRSFRGDGFIFDYHLFWLHSFIEPTGLAFAETMYRDIQAIENIGLKGMVNCQVQRYFFPTGLIMEMSGRALWNNRVSLSEIKVRYFEDAFGEWGPTILERLDRLAGKVNDPMLYDYHLTPRDGYLEDLSDAQRIAAEFTTFLRKLLAADGAARSAAAGIVASLGYLALGLGFTERLLPGLKALARRDAPGFRASLLAAESFLDENEPALEMVCDTIMWRQWLSNEAEKVTVDAIAPLK